MFPLTHHHRSLSLIVSERLVKVVSDGMAVGTCLAVGHYSDIIIDSCSIKLLGSSLEGGC